MKPVLLIDFGSTYTKVTAVDLEGERLLGTADSYTTVQTDVGEGLENALRNIFENNDEHMYFVLLIINPHHMRLLGLPREEMTKEEACAQMTAHLNRCQASLEAYFELTLDIKRIVGYDSLYALGRENSLRTAH